MVLCQWWDLWQECFSAFSTCFCFISHPVYRNHSGLLWIALRGSFSVYSCIFGASVGEGKSKRLLCHHLVWESKYSFVLSCLKWFLVHHFLVRISHGMYKTLELFYFQNIGRFWKIFQKYNWIKITFWRWCILRKE